VNNPLFIVMFEDKTVYYGKKTYEDSGWKECPNKPIQKIFFCMPTVDYIGLMGYDKYARFVEAVQIVMGEDAGKQRCEFVYFLGKRKNRIVQYKMNIVSGNIIINEFDETDTYIKSLNPEIWRG
jgi:hypothetical protein